MPLPFSESVPLSGPERARLEALVRAGSTPQALVFRCRVILRAAEDDHPSNLQIAAEFRCDRHTVGVWRNRYLKGCNRTHARGYAAFLGHLFPEPS